MYNFRGANNFGHDCTTVQSLYLQAKLACRNAGLSLDGIIWLAICLDQHLGTKQHCVHTLPSSSDCPTPELFSGELGVVSMQLGPPS